MIQANRIERHNEKPSDRPGEFSPELKAKANETLPLAQAYFPGKVNKLEAFELPEDTPEKRQKRLEASRKMFIAMNALAQEIKQA